MNKTNLLTALIVLILLSCSVFQPSQGQPAAQIKSIPLGSLGQNSYSQIGLGRVFDTQYSPDGKILAVGTSISVIFYDASTFDIIRTIPASFVEKLEWAPGGEFLAIGDSSKLSIYDYHNDKLTSIEDGADLNLSGGSYQLTWSPNGQYLAAATLLLYQADAWVWDVKTQKRIYDLQLNQEFGVYKYAQGINWSADGRNLAVAFNISGSGAETELLAVWNLSGSNPRLTSQWAVPKDPFSSDTARVYWFSGDRYLMIVFNAEIAILDTTSGKIIKQLTTIEPILDVAFLANGQLGMTLGTKYLTLREYKLPSLEEVARINYPANPFCAPQTIQYNGCDLEKASLAPDARSIAASNSSGDHFFVFDQLGSTVPKSIFMGSQWNNDLAFSPDSHYVATLGQDGIVRTYGVESLKLIEATPYSNTLAWSETGNFINSSGKDLTQHLALAGTFKREVSTISPDGKLEAQIKEATEAECRFLFCVPGSKYRLTISLLGSNNFIYSLALQDTSMEIKWSPDSKWLIATGMPDNDNHPTQYGLVIVSVDQENKSFLISDTGAIKGIDWSSDGRYFGITGFTGVIRLFQVDATLAAVGSVR